ncbi:MAG TPA: UvrB/UvrC motif-containing protein [Candidatus Angelobacter sp.]|nr:UvrB/UvrC motif-containing protein [Candidatus Angelobacter sp.]
MLTNSIPFSPENPPDFFAQFPATAAVFLLSAADESAEPYISKTANLRRRLQRLLAPPESQSKRLNLRERVARIEYALTGSDFEATLLQYRLLRSRFPETYQKRLRLRPAPVVRFALENEYPRAYVTTRIGKLTGKSLYYGPFRSRTVAEKFLNDSLDLFKMRRCTFDLNPDPAFPGCVYSEMKMCLAPCFKGCTDEAYSGEVARVQAYLDSGGDSLISELEQERERLSAELDFEGAAAQHARIGKIKGILSACDEICGRLDRLDAVIIQPSPEQNAVTLFRFHLGAIAGPAQFSLESEDENGSRENRLRDVIDQLAISRASSVQRLSEELAMLKRWYYRSHKVGEVFFANQQGELPMRRIVRGAGRVCRGEKEPSVEMSDEELRSGPKA